MSSTSLPTYTGGPDGASVAGSTLETVPFWFTLHTSPKATAVNAGLPPTSIRAATRSPAGGIRSIEPSKFETHTVPSAATAGPSG
jgi:hypothetical protein